MFFFLFQSSTVFFFTFFNHFLLLLYYSCLNFSPFALLLPFHPQVLNQSPHCCLCPWVIHTCPNSFPFSFHHHPPSHSHLDTVSLFHISMPLVLFCSLVYFVHLTPLTGEIIWYLSFINWLISLSIIFSSSIHAVVEGRCSFFLSSV